MPQKYATQLAIFHPKYLLLCVHLHEFTKSLFLTKDTMENFLFVLLCNKNENTNLSLVLSDFNVLLKTFVVYIYCEHFLQNAL